MQCNVGCANHDLRRRVPSGPLSSSIPSTTGTEAQIKACLAQPLRGLSFGFATSIYLIYVTVEISHRQETISVTRSRIHESPQAQGESASANEASFRCHESLEPNPRGGCAAWEVLARLGADPDPTTLLQVLGAEFSAYVMVRVRTRT